MVDKKIVTIGGGTGSSVLLHGLKNFTKEITAIVTVADDGGGSGVLREDLGMLPPGDIRACLIALSNAENEMEKLMRYRFDENAGRLAGQSFGNLFIAALNNIYKDFEVGLRKASDLLAITGKVVPMTLENVVLYAELEDGSVIEGESNITFLTRKSGGRIKRVFVQPNELQAPINSLKAIEEADAIILGPGSLYTSVMPNLLVKPITEAVIKSKAKKFYVTNVMTQSGETDGYTPFDHLKAILNHTGGENFIDYILVNKEEISSDVKMKYYYKENSKPVLLDERSRKKLDDLGVEVIEGKFIEVVANYIRHDAKELCKMIMKVLEE